MTQLLYWLRGPRLPASMRVGPVSPEDPALRLFVKLIASRQPVWTPRDRRLGGGLGPPPRRPADRRERIPGGVRFRRSPGRIGPKEDSSGGSRPPRVRSALQAVGGRLCGELGALPPPQRPRPEEA
jgi:hypothetical protein